MLLVIGTDDALLEGLAQSLATNGRRVATCQSLDEAAQIAEREPPLLLLVDRALLGPGTEGALGRVPLSTGGALVTYRSAGAFLPSLSLPPTLSRLQIADLELPLERNRLLALAERLDARARQAGRDRGARPPDPPVP
ncbi:MAG TPA: hypothetical protein VLE53_16285 [Gemmatimonadaceae bacterium]|nr:hypothetical protein [Gemmatimonadaceae bacterium]